MTPLGIIHRLRALGVAVWVSNQGDVRVDPVDAIPADLLAAAKSQKHKISRLLSEPPWSSWDGTWPEHSNERGRLISCFAARTGFSAESFFEAMDEVFGYDAIGPFRLTNGQLELVLGALKEIWQRGLPRSVAVLVEVCRVVTASTNGVAVNDAKLAHDPPPSAQAKRDANQEPLEW